MGELSMAAQPAGQMTVSGQMTVMDARQAAQECITPRHLLFVVCSVKKRFGYQAWPVTTPHVPRLRQRAIKQCVEIRVTRRILEEVHSR